MIKRADYEHKIDFILDTESEVANLPELSDTVGVGSKAFCIENSKYYMINSEGVWGEVNLGSGGGGIEPPTVDLNYDHIMIWRNNKWNPMVLERAENDYSFNGYEIIDNGPNPRHGDRYVMKIQSVKYVPYLDNLYLPNYKPCPYSNVPGTYDVETKRKHACGVACNPHQMNGQIVVPLDNSDNVFSIRVFGDDYQYVIPSLQVYDADGTLIDTLTDVKIKELARWENLVYVKTDPEAIQSNAFFSYGYIAKDSSGKTPITYACTSNYLTSLHIGIECDNNNQPFDNDLANWPDNKITLSAFKTMLNNKLYKCGSWRVDSNGDFDENSYNTICALKPVTLQTYIDDYNSENGTSYTVDDLKLYQEDWGPMGPEYVEVPEITEAGDYSFGILIAQDDGHGRIWYRVDGSTFNQCHNEDFKSWISITDSKNLSWLTITDSRT